MNITSTSSIAAPQGVKKQEISPTPLEGSTSLEIARFAPLIGSFCAHNFTQGLLLNKSVSYLANPVTNYFMNPLFASLAGSIAFFVAKAGLCQSDQKKALTDHEGVSKSILWSSFFTALSAFEIKDAVLNGTTDPLSKLFFILIPSPAAQIGFVIASMCLSAAIYDLASEMFKEKPQELDSTDLS